MNEEVSPDEVAEMSDITRRIVDFLGDNLDVASPYYAAHSFLLISTALFKMVGINPEDSLSVVNSGSHDKLIKSVQDIISLKIAQSYEKSMSDK